MEQKIYTLNDGRKIQIRALEPEDGKRLADFYGSMSEDSLMWIQVPSQREIDEKLRYPDYYISLVTLYDDHVAGYGEILKDPQKRDGELNIHIHQDYQGVGLGTAMMIMLLKEATDEHLHSINLHVAAENMKAVQLFIKFGFQEQKTKGSIEQKDTVHMIKKLQR
jgi:ribosomal protein S18 acetylase RimI-like enzyme